MPCASASTRRKADAGLTLIEVLVVLSIIAITAGAAMLRLGFGHGQDDLTAAANAMALAVTEASDAALTSGQDRILELGPEAYFIRVDGRTSDPDWRKVSGLMLAAAQGETGPWRLSADAASPPFGVRLSAGHQSVTLWFDGLRARVEAVP